MLTRRPRPEPPRHSAKPLVQPLQAPKWRAGEPIELTACRLIAAELGLEHADAPERLAKPGFGCNQLITRLEELLLQLGRVAPVGGVVFQALPVVCDSVVVELEPLRGLIHRSEIRARGPLRGWHGRNVTAHLRE